VRSRSLLALLLILLIFGLTPLAYADPPDPSWLAGYWDDDDFDNTVTFIVGTFALHAVVPTDAGPLAVRITHLPPATASANPAPVCDVGCSRAPPVAFSPDC